MSKPLLLVAGSGDIQPRTFPTSWTVTREATNPVINVLNNPNETLEQYVPAPIRLTNGDVWCYVKGNSVIYAWKSTDGGVTFSLQNSNNAVIGHGTAGAWDSKFALEPAAVYDAANDLIHLWYKGTNDATGATNWQWGHATAPGSTPTVFTKDAGNPILTNANASTQLGGATVTDLAVSDVIKIGSTFHFYGYANYNGGYELIHASGSSWNNPASTTSILTAATAGVTVVETPTVFVLPNYYTPTYAMLYTLGGTLAAGRSIRAASSSDGVSWSFAGSDVIAPTSGWEANSAYSCSVLKDTADPFVTALTDTSNRMKVYYSGYNASTGRASSGLAYLTPT